MLIQIIHNFLLCIIFILLIECLPIGVCIIICHLQSIHDIMLVCTIEDWCRYVKSKYLCSKAKVNLKHLSDIHTGRYAQWVQHDIKWTTIWQEWHIFYRKYTGNNTLVTMTSSHLITNGDFSLLCNVNADCLVYSRRKFVAVFTGKYFGVHDDTILTVRYFQGSITYFSCFLAKDGTEQTLLCGQLSLSLRSYFSDQNITGTYLCTDADDSTLIQIFQSIITDTRNVFCDLFRSKLGVTGLCLVLLDVDGSVNIILYQTLA